jgi:hypothetical protein
LSVTTAGYKNRCVNSIRFINHSTIAFVMAFKS